MLAAILFLHYSFFLDKDLMKGWCWILFKVASIFFKFFKAFLIKARAFNPRSWLPSQSSWCYPMHTTHKLQPLDSVFMKSSKDACFEECGLWMRAKTGGRITKYGIARILSQVFSHVSLALRVSILRNLDFNALEFCLWIQTFTVLDFLPTAVSYAPMQNVATQPSTNKDIITVIYQLSPVPNLQQSEPCVDDEKLRKVWFQHPCPIKMLSPKIELVWWILDSVKLTTSRLMKHVLMLKKAQLTTLWVLQSRVNKYIPN